MLNNILFNILVCIVSHSNIYTPSTYPQVPIAKEVVGASMKGKRIDPSSQSEYSLEE